MNMKKFMCLLLVIPLLFLGGCANIGITAKDDAAITVTAKIAGHRAGFELAKVNLGACREFIEKADEFMVIADTGKIGDSNTLIQDAIDRLTVEVAKYTDDPATIAEVVILADSFQFTGDIADDATTKEVMAFWKAHSVEVKAFMDGFKKGVDLWDRVRP